MADEIDVTPHVSMFRRFIICKPAVFTGVASALGFYLFLSLPSVFSNHNDAARLINRLLVTAGACVLFGAWTIRSTEKRERKLEDQKFARQLSEQERLDLFIWGKYGIKPKAKMLQPILPKYVALSEAQLRTDSPDARKILLFMILFASGLTIWSGLSILQTGIEVQKLEFFILGVFLFTMLTIGRIRTSGLPGSRKPTKLHLQVERMRNQL